MAVRWGSRQGMSDITKLLWLSIPLLTPSSKSMVDAFTNSPEKIPGKGLLKSRARGEGPAYTGQ